MHAVQCPRCSSTFDVSRLEPGSVFICGSCRTELTVPPRGAPAPAAPAARKPRRRAPVNVTPVGPSPAASPRPRATSSSRRSNPRRAGPRRASPDTGGSSRLPLILVGAGAVAAVIAIVLVFVFSGESDPDTVIANEPATDTGPTFAEQVGTLEDKLLEYSGNTMELERIHGEAKTLKASGLARKAAEQALRLDEQLAWAHLEMGHVKFDASDLPDEDAVVYTTPDWDMLLAAQQEGWLSADRQAELTEAKDRFRAHMERLKSDGHYKRICMWQSNVAKHPVFSHYNYTTVEEGPYLIFIQKSDDRRKAAQLEEMAKRKAAIYRCLYKTFLDRFGERFKLGPLHSKNFKDDRVLKAWIFADRKSFDEYHKYIGMPMGDNVGAYFNPVDQWMIIPNEVGGGIGNIGNQNMDVNVSFHEGTHQLIHYYTKRLVQKAVGEEISWTDSRLNSNSHWFQEGVAEWFGSAVKQGDGWDLFQTNIYRLMHWKSDRRGKLEEWSFEDLLAASDNGDLNRRGGRMGALYYAQAWAFISFLWNFEDGKYREKFLTYFGRELTGESGLRVFKEVFGITEIKGSTIEKEYQEYCKKLIDGVSLPNNR